MHWLIVQYGKQPLNNAWFTSWEYSRCFFQIHSTDSYKYSLPPDTSTPAECFLDEKNLATLLCLDIIQII